MLADARDRPFPNQPISAQTRTVRQRDVDWFGPRTNAATRHSDKRRRRLIRCPMDRSPKPTNPEKVDRAIELRGRGGDPSSAAFGHTIVNHRRSRPHSGSGPRPLGAVSHSHAPTPTARGAATCRFNRSAHTHRRADAKKSRRGLRPTTVGQRTRRHPAIERQTHGSSRGQPDPEQSYSMHHIAHTRPSTWLGRLLWRWRLVILVLQTFRWHL